jgi:hypothetical protein
MAAEENEHPPCPSVSTEESAAVETDGLYRIDFADIIRSFEQKLKNKIALQHSSSCRLYICCSKEYVDRPSKSWWRVCLIDALLTSFCKLQKRDNGVFNSFAVLCDSAFAGIPSCVLKNPKELIMIDVVNIPKAWTKLSLIYEDWASSLSSNQISSTNVAIKKRAKQMENFRVACAGLEDSFTQIIEQGLNLALEALRKAFKPAMKCISSNKKRKPMEQAVNGNKRFDRQIDHIKLSEPKDAVLPVNSGSRDDLLLMLFDAAIIPTETPTIESSAACFADSGSQIYMNDTPDSSQIVRFGGLMPIAPAFGISLEDNFTNKNTDSTADNQTK